MRYYFQGDADRSQANSQAPRAVERELLEERMSS